MDRNARDFITARDIGVDGLDDAGMLLECEFKIVRHGRVVHPHIDSLLRRLEKTEQTLASWDCLGWKINSPIAFLIPEMRLELICKHIPVPHMFCLHAHFRRWCIQISEIWILDGLDGQRRIVIQGAFECQHSAFQGYGRRECYRQDSAMFAD